MRSAGRERTRPAPLSAYRPAGSPGIDQHQARPTSSVGSIDVASVIDRSTVTQFARSRRVGTGLGSSLGGRCGCRQVRFAARVRRDGGFSMSDPVMKSMTAAATGSGSVSAIALSCGGMSDDEPHPSSVTNLATCATLGRRRHPGRRRWRRPLLQPRPLSDGFVVAEQFEGLFEAVEVVRADQHSSGLTVARDDDRRGSRSTRSRRTGESILHVPQRVRCHGQDRATPRDGRQPTR